MIFWGSPVELYPARKSIIKKSSGWKQAKTMHYKTRTYLNEAVIVRSTGCDMNEVWSMYAKMNFCRLTHGHVICFIPNKTDISKADYSSKANSSNVHDLLEQEYSTSIYHTTSKLSTKLLNLVVLARTKFSTAVLVHFYCILVIK